MPLGGAESERALVLTTRKADTQVALRVLSEAGIATSVCGDMTQLVWELSVGAVNAAASHADGQHDGGRISNGDNNAVRNEAHRP